MEDSLLEISAHPQMIKDYLVAIRNNARQWSANTKGRKEINRTGKKPHPQKGGGRSRQGCLAAPQYKGGGIVFGPKPKFDQHVRINKKERKAAIRSMIAEKIRDNQVRILSNAEMNEPKTKTVVSFLKAANIEASRVLFVGADMSNLPLLLSLRNLPKKEYSTLNMINGYDLALCRELIVLEPVLEQFLAILG